MVKFSEVQKYAREFSPGVDLSQLVINHFGFHVWQIFCKDTLNIIAKLTIKTFVFQVKRRRESREREQYKASAPPMEPQVSTTPAYTPGGVARTYSNATPASVQRTNSNAGSMPHRPHKFQDKKMYGNREKCGPCEKKIRIAKSYLRCQVKKTFQLN